VPAALPDVPGAEVVDVGVPAALLDRRPDVVAADLSLRAANEQIGVSIAQLYPNLVLTANFGYTGDRWEDIWQSYTETYSALINLAQPIFEGGRLRAQVAAAKARYAELAANYAGTVLTAIREVEDALAAERLLRRQIESVRLQLREAEASEDLARQRYQRGVESILTVLETERSRLAAEEQVAVLQGQIWTARVNLHLALGGDWVEDGSTEE
jgi:outer membrane protein TolC